MPEPLRNWAGNLRFATDRVYRPRSVEQLRAFVRQHPRLKVLGTRHSFSGIADSADHFISLADLPRAISVDAASRTVTVDGGITYGQLCPELHRHGLALHNLASLPHISVAGACATATHGSGAGHGNLATAVSALELVTADGEVVRLKRGDAGFNGAVVHLGALGVVTALTLDVQPAFTMRQDVYLDLPMAQLVDRFDEIVRLGYSVSLFTEWQGGQLTEVWIKRRVEPRMTNSFEAQLVGAHVATADVHPIAALSAEHCTEQLGIEGPWHERLPHFRMGFTPSSGAELQSEYFVPLRHAIEAILAVERLRDRVSPHLLVSELRTVAGDGLWTSPCYDRDSLALHFTWKQEWESVRLVLPLIERELMSFGVRPHWGKLFTLEPSLVRRGYDRWQDFADLAARLDPAGKFRNAFLDAIFGAAGATAPRSR